MILLKPYGEFLFDYLSFSHLDSRVVSHLSLNNIMLRIFVIWICNRILILEQNWIEKESESAEEGQILAISLCLNFPFLFYLFISFYSVGPSMIKRTQKEERGDLILLFLYYPRPRGFSTSEISLSLFLNWLRKFCTKNIFYNTIGRKPLGLYSG